MADAPGGDAVADKRPNHAGAPPPSGPAAADADPDEMWARVCRDGDGGKHASLFVWLYRMLMRPILSAILRLASAPGQRRGLGRALRRGARPRRCPNLGQLTPVRCFPAASRPPGSPQ
jgi:hypothetical protein